MPDAKIQPKEQSSIGYKISINNLLYGSSTDPAIDQLNSIYMNEKTISMVLADTDKKLDWALQNKSLRLINHYASLKAFLEAISTSGTLNKRDSQNFINLNLDTNGDGFINEFDVKSFDLNKDGFINKEEMKECLQENLCITKFGPNYKEKLNVKTLKELEPQAKDTIKVMVNGTLITKTNVDIKNVKGTKYQIEGYVNGYFDIEETLQKNSVFDQNGNYIKIKDIIKTESPKQPQKQKKFLHTIFNKK